MTPWFLALGDPWRSWRLGGFLIAIASCVGGLQAEEPPPSDYAELIEQLGHPAYEQRLDAQRRFLDEGLRAFDALRAGREQTDPEVSDACTRLLEDLGGAEPRRGDPTIVRKWLRAMENGSLGRRLDVVEGLGELPGEIALPALARIARFDPHDRVAREAARALIDGAATPLQASRRTAIASIVADLTNDYGPGERAAARWLQIAVAEHTPTSTSDASQAWRREAERQLRLLRRGADTTSAEIVATLATRWLRAALAEGDDPSAVASIDTLVAIDDEQAVARLTTALRTAAKAGRGRLTDEVIDAHQDRLNTKRGVYARAEVALIRGDEAAATELAEAAFATEAVEIAASVEDVLIGSRVMVAGELRDAGQTEWAIAEYRAAAASDDPLDGRAAVAAWRLNNLLFDAERYAEASEALVPVVKAVHATRATRQQYANLPQVQRDEPLLPGSGSLKSRQLFAEALAARATGDHGAEVRLLRQAITADASDADVVLAMHRVATQRLEDTPQAFIDETRRRIVGMRLEFEREIWDRPDRAAGYNQWAWLVANTEGDYDKAVRYSRRSLDIAPETAGYLDTLGRCLFSAGRVREAVAIQRRAVELEPTMLVLARQLAEFEQALAAIETEDPQP